MNPYDDAPTNVQGPPPPPGRPLNPSQRSAIAAALAGTAALGGAAYGMAQFLDDDQGDQTAQETGTDTSTGGAGVVDTTGGAGVDTGQPVAQVEISGPPLVSDTNYNEMTFDEAFHAAREEMGKGNYFEWHGNLYNTYYQDEWSGMSPAQHQDFLASVYPDGIPGAEIEHGQEGNVMVAHSGEIPPPVEASDNDVRPDDSVVAIDDSTTADKVQASTVSNEGSVTVDDDAGGSDGHVQVEVATTVEMDGQNVSVYDINHDGHADMFIGNDSHIALIDTDNDHILDTQATYDSETHQLTGTHPLNEPIPYDMPLDTGHQSTHPDALFTSNDDFGPDFSNDEDTTDFNFTA